MRSISQQSYSRRRGGFVSGKLIVWSLIGFALYTGYSYFPAYLQHSQLEGAVQNVLKHGSHKLKDETIVTKALTAASSMEIPLEAKDILIRREQSDGERTLHVEFAFPVEISYLGARTVIRQAHAVQSYEVDEAAEARHAAQRERKAERRAEQRQERGERVADYQQRIKEECGKNTRDVYVSHVSVHNEDGSVRQIVDCDQAARW